MKRPIKVVMLPTEDKSVVRRNTYKFTKEHGNPLEYMEIDNLPDAKRYQERGYEFQHLYITISQDVEPIKENDWHLHYYEGKSIIGKSFNGGEKVLSKDTVKIIATTDPKCHTTYIPDTNGDMMRREGIPQIQQSFIKEYAVNPNGEWEVEYNCHDWQFPDRRECQLKLNKDNTVNITSVEKKKIYIEADGLFTIINVEDHKYLSYYHGGLIHMESCKCIK